MNDQTARLVTRLRERLDATMRRITWAELAFGTAVAAGTATGTWLIATVLEASLWLGTEARTVIAGALGLLIVGLASTLLARPIGRLLGLVSGPSDEEVARIVGDAYPTVSDRLVNLLQLAEGKSSRAPAPFVDQAVEDLASELEDVSFQKVEDFGRARKAIRLASLPVVGLLAFLLIAPSTFLNASERLLAPRTTFTPPAPFRLTVSPQDTRVVRGDSVTIRAAFSGTMPQNVSVGIRRSESSDTEQVPLTVDSSGTATHRIAPVRRSFRYRIVASPLETEWYTVTVQKRPLVQELQLSVTPPAYTGRPDETLQPNIGDVAGLPGTLVDLSATVGGAPVDSAQLVFSSDRTVPLQIDEQTVSGTFRLRREDTYALRLVSPAGTKNHNPIRYQISVQSDARPSVTLLQPEGTADLGASLTQQLRIQLSDDFGFTRARLFYRLNKQRFEDDQSDFSSISLTLPNSQKSRQELVYDWLLAQDTGLDPKPGEVVQYYVKAWDNDTVNGPKPGRTSTHRLRMPSMAEKYEQFDDAKEDVSEQLDQLRERADSVRDQSRQLRKELRRTREADWQDRRQVEQIQKKQKSLQDGAEKLSEKVRNMNRQMEQNQLSSSEMAEQFRELRRVIDEIKSPELQKALEELKRAMKNNDQGQMQKALEKVQTEEKSYREQLERTLSLFKKLKAQQRLEEFSRRAGELSDRQKELRERTRKRMNTPNDSSATNAEHQRATSTPSEDSTAQAQPRSESESGPEETSASEQEQDGQPSAADSAASEKNQRPPASDSEKRRQRSKPRRSNDDLAEEQSRSANQMQELMKKMSESMEEMNDVQSAPQKQLKELNRELRRRDLPQQMQKNEQQLRKNKLNDAQRGQKQMQKQLSQMQKQLSKMKSQMQGKQRQINIAGLRSALANTLRLSKRQEGLRLQTEDLATEGPSLRSFAREQKDMSDGLRTVTDSLSSIAKRVPEMSREVQELSGNALRAMETATTALEKRTADKATGPQKTSMMHLNKLALLLSDLLEKLQKNQQGSGSGMSMQQMIQKMQKMSGQQQKLNKKIQQHLNSVQGERLSPDESERQKKLARQQRQIKKQLDEMNVGSEAENQILGDLQKIAEQMNESAQQLEQGRHSRDLIERQQQILTRLLNAQKSLRTQGKQKERRGEEATDEYDRSAPGQIPPSTQEDQLRRDLIRALEMGYTPSYEELIKRYFELLQKEEEEQTEQ